MDKAYVYLHTKDFPPAMNRNRNRPRRRPRSFSQKFWEDPQGNVVIWQKPNRFLLTWLIGTILTWVLPFGSLTKFIGLVTLIALIIWAVLEVYSGADYFRRLLGLLILLALLIVHTL